MIDVFGCNTCNAGHCIKHGRTGIEISNDDWDRPSPVPDVEEGWD